MEVIFANDIYRVTTYNVDFTYTFRGESFDVNSLNADIILDTNGFFYKKNDFRDTASMSIVGGIDKYVNAKSEIQAYPFYITVPQKIAIYNIFRKASFSVKNITINSPNQTLKTFLESVYLNFKG